MNFPLVSTVVFPLRCSIAATDIESKHWSCKPLLNLMSQPAVAPPLCRIAWLEAWTYVCMSVDRGIDLHLYVHDRGMDLYIYIMNT